MRPGSPVPGGSVSRLSNLGLHLSRSPLADPLEGTPPAAGDTPPSTVPSAHGRGRATCASVSRGRPPAVARARAGQEARAGHAPHQPARRQPAPQRARASIEGGSRLHEEALEGWEVVSRRIPRGPGEAYAALLGQRSAVQTAFRRPGWPKSGGYLAKLSRKRRKFCRTPANIGPDLV